jgi:O-antigen ligase
VISRRLSHTGKFAATILLLAALVLPQTIEYEKDLLWCLPAYGAIAIAMLIVAATLGLDCRGDIFCLVAALAFVGYIDLRALTSPAPYFGRTELYLASGALTIYGLVATGLRGATNRIALVVLLLGFAVCHVLVGLVQFGLGENLFAASSLSKIMNGQRASGLYVDPDHLAGLLEVLGVLGLSVTCWSRWPAWARVVVGYLTLNCYFGAVLTASRGAYVSITVSLLVFAVLSAITLRAGGNAVFRRYGAIGLIALTVLLGAGASFIHQNARLSASVARITEIDTGRIDMWRAAIQQWKLQPVVGTGGGTFQFYGRHFRTERMQVDPVDAHNDYLQLLGDYGLIGALLFLLFFFAHLRNGWRTFLHFGPERLRAGSLPLSNRLALAIGALCATSAYVVHSAVDFNLHIPANALVVAFVFGILANPAIKLRSGDRHSQYGSLVKFVFIGAAIVLVIQCARLFPGEYYADRALAALENENPAQAISYANEALKWEHRNPNIFSCLGRAQRALGNVKDQAKERLPYYQRALAVFNKARLLAPLEVGYPLDMAFTYDQMNRFAEAEWMYGIARSLDPRSISISQMYQSHLEAWKTSNRKS